MTIPASSAPAARQWLFDQITAAAQPDPNDKTARLIVCYDEPGPDQPEDIIAVGAISRDIGVDSVVGSGAAGWLNERYRITVAVEIFRGGDSAETVFSRACTLVDTVASVVRADPAMGGAVLVARPVSSDYSATWSDEHSGFLGSASVVIECFQRI